MFPRAQQEEVQVIAFQPPPDSGQQHLTTNATRPLRRERPNEDTLAWYYSLVSKNIQSMRLHKGDGGSCFVTLLMQDSSLFKLELSQRNSSGSSRSAKVVCIMSRLRDTASLLSSRWISIELAQDPPPPVADMRFVLAICCGACRLLHPSKPGHTLLFALALVTSVAQKCIPIHNHLTDNTGTPLDGFWREVSASTEVISRSPWQDDIASERRSRVRDWIFRAAREHIQSSFFNMNSPGNQKNEVRQRQRTLAASVVAWLEFSTSQLETASLVTWDAEWDATWRREWGKEWEANCENEQELSRLALIKLANNTEFHDFVFSNSTIGANGRLSGRIAGRMSMQVSLASAAAKIPERSLSASEGTYITQTNAQEIEGGSEIYLLIHTYVYISH